jgi:N-acetylglutamate synthase-like GNAT family acetyltransferase
MPRIRKASPGDFPGIRRLASALGLDYEDMEADPFWIVADDGRTIGQVGLKSHADSDELVALGVEPSRRSEGWGRRLVEALMAEARGPVYLATLIPGFFETCGFRRTAEAPPGILNKPASWCEGCPRTGCTVMVRRPR